MLPQAASDHDAAQRRLTLAALAAVRAEWSNIGEDFDVGWQQVGQRIALLVAAAQLGAARDGITFVLDALAEQGLPTPDQVPAAAAFAGTATPVAGPFCGDLETLLYGAVTKARTADAGSLAERLNAGQRWLNLVVDSQVNDAARDAASVTVAATPRTGWVRMVSTPCCPRCAVLAGRWYRWDAGFARHPRCHCRGIPAAEDRADDMRTDPKALVQAGLLHGLSAADTRAIVDDGADVARVINAHRGMATAKVGGRTVKVTSEAVGTVARAAGVSGRGFVRLRPEAIYDAAEDRADAVRLLRRNGYLL